MRRARHAETQAYPRNSNQSRTLMMSPRIALAAGVFLAGAPGLAGTASAHPHVYVTVETTVLYDKGTITGLRQRWMFDEFYTTMAIEGLDTNNDGIYDRKELAELAKVNVEGLAQTEYFTYAKLGGQPLAFDAPKDYWMDHVAIAAPPGRLTTSPAGAPPTPPPDAKAADQSGFWNKLVGRMTSSAAAAPEPVKVLALEFTLPLKQPVLAEAQGFEYSVNDPGFWIWFDLASTKGASLGAGAPAGCKAEIGLPKQDAAELQRLGESFFSQMGGSQAGIGAGKTVSVTCPKP